MKTRKPNAAFTLLELLVVIAIIGVLSAMLFPAISAARDRARTAGCASNLKQIGAGIILYAGDNNGSPPPQTVQRNYGDVVLGGNVQHWLDEKLVGQYVGHRGSWGRVDANSVFLCPSDTQLPPSHLPVSTNIDSSYGYNDYIHGTSEQDSRWGVLSRDVLGQIGSLARFSQPAKTLLVIEGNTRSFHPGYGNPPPCYGLTEPHSGSFSIGAPNGNFNWMKRHGGRRGGNMVMLDGSVRYTEDLSAEAVAGRVVFRPD
ncbi:MAG TPA: type II secretion system protein [Kiritimatiellia bacterium]|nr:type II secretion system protein [Kiritimatiellia bacterium]HMO99416.1 type II secretion system protein [Kiritimatiellia bacterium]HMP96821.1 type II secretion system protein [Kiritimatiellia bacterium]